MSEDLPDYDLTLELQRAQDYEQQAADIRKNVRCELMSRYIVRLCNSLEQTQALGQYDQLISEARTLAMKDKP